VEKRTPHYDLARIQSDVARLGAAAFTKRDAAPVIKFKEK
jgi:hypothetical protein